MKKLLAVLTPILCIFLVLLMVGSYGVFAMIFMPRGTLGSLMNLDTIPPETGPKNYYWKDQVRQVTVQSEDGLTLSGYEYIHGPSARWVILIHGYDSNATHMAIYADRFIRHGNNVLAVDLRAHGNSEGKYCGFGRLESRDLLVWADHIESITPGARIVLLGTSMGGGTALQAAALAPERFDKVVADSVPPTYTVVFQRYLKETAGPLSPLVIGALSLYSRIFAGYWLREADPIHCVDDITIPVLFVHGVNDGLVPVKAGQKLYDRCTAPKQQLLVEEAGHTHPVYVNPRLFWETVEPFLDN